MQKLERVEEDGSTHLPNPKVTVGADSEAFKHWKRAMLARLSPVIQAKTSVIENLVQTAHGFGRMNTDILDRLEELVAGVMDGKYLGTYEEARRFKTHLNALAMMADETDEEDAGDEEYVDDPEEKKRLSVIARKKKEKKERTLAKTNFAHTYKNEVDKFDNPFNPHVPKLDDDQIISLVDQVLALDLDQTNFEADLDPVPFEAIKHLSAELLFAKLIMMFVQERGEVPEGRPRSTSGVGNCQVGP